MFKKWKDRLNEVSEEVKKDPRFQNSLASVQKVASDTYSVINKESSGSRESLQADPASGASGGFGSEHLPLGASGLSNDHLFSLGDDDENIMSTSSNPNSPAKGGDPASAPLPGFESVELANPNMPPNTSTPRVRRGSSSSTTTEAAALFPIYEAPQQMFTLPSSNDLDSTAGSEWEDGQSQQSQQLGAVTKEQLFQMLQKTRARYHKYKGRYTDVAKAYTELEAENAKVKNIMQQTQDKALRRISELKEQCQLESKAKRHLEEELRSDMEEKEHIIKALQTKVTLLKSRAESESEDTPINSTAAITTTAALSENGDEPVQDENLIDLEGSASNGANGGGDIKALPALGGKKDSAKVKEMEEKIKRLEALLTKCKESIKANKQKTQALTEVKESLATTLGEREKECDQLKSQVKDFEARQAKAQEEELQIAETKMMMHQEIITKDEEIGSLRIKLKDSADAIEVHNTEIKDLKQEIDQMKDAQSTLENALESDKVSALQEMSKAKTSALQTLQQEMEQNVLDLKEKHENDLKDLEGKLKKQNEEALAAAEKEKERELMLKDASVKQLLEEKEEDSRLAREELELRVTSMANADGSKSQLLQDLETKVVAAGSMKAAIDKELTTAKERVSKLEEEKKKKEEERKKLLSEKKQLTKAKNQAEKDLKSATDKLAAMESTSLDSETLKARLESEKTQTSEAKEAVEKELQSVKDKLEAAEDQDKKRQADKEKLEGDVKKIKDNLTKVNKEKGELQKTLKNAKKEFAEEKKALKKEFDHLKESHDKVSSDLSDTESRLANFEEASKSETVASESKIEALQSDLETVRKAAAESQAKLSELEREMKAKEVIISKLKEDHQASLHSLEEQFSDQKSGQVTEAAEQYEKKIRLMQESHASELQSKIEEVQELERKVDNESERMKVLNGDLESAKKELGESSKAMIAEQKKVKEQASQLSAAEKKLEDFAQNLEKAKEKQNAGEKEQSEAMKKLEEDLARSHQDLEEEKGRSEDNSNLAKTLESELQRIKANTIETNRVHEDNEQSWKVSKQKLESDLEQSKVLLEEEKVASGKRTANLEAEIQKLERQVKLSLESTETQGEASKTRIEELEADLGVLKKELESAKSSASDQVQKLTQNLEKSGASLREMEKTIASFQDRENSQKELEQQMISYEKELQGMLKKLEDEQKLLKESIERLELSNKDKVQEIRNLKQQNEDEITRLRADLDMKIRLEREKENSYKDHQSQSIEYQKKLQEQIEEARDEVNKSKASLKKIQSAHSKEIDQLTSRINDLMDNLSITEAAKDQAAGDLDNFRAEMEAKETSNDNKFKEELEKLGEKLKVLAGNESELKNKIASKEAEAKSLVVELDQLKKLNGDFEAKLVAATDKAQESANAMQEMEARLQNLTSATDDVSKKNEELADIRTSLDNVKKEHQSFIEEKAKELSEFQEKLVTSEADKEELKSKLSVVQEESRVQRESFENVHEENRQLAEDLVLAKASDSKSREKSSSVEQRLEQAGKDALDTQAKLGESERRLKSILEQLESKNKDIEKLEDKIAEFESQSHVSQGEDKKAKSRVRELESKLADLEVAHASELNTLRDESETELSRQVNESRDQISTLKHDLYEKTTLYEELMDKHAAEMKAKQSEMDEEVEACSRMFQSKLSEFESTHETKVLELETKLKNTSNWGWDQHGAEEVEDLQTVREAPAQLATLPVTSAASNNHVGTVSIGGHPLEEATEFEYLRNILYQYMLGKESLTLAKVLATIVKFTPDQMREIESKEEKRHSLLSGIGLT